MSKTADEDGSETAVESYFDQIDDRVHALFETALTPRLEALEADRLRVRSFIVRAAIAAAIPVLLFIFSERLQILLLPYGDSSPIVRFAIDHIVLVLVGIAILVVAFIIFRVAIPGIAAHLNYRRRFKQDIATEIFRTVVPDGTYQPDHHITKATVDESGLFSGSYQSFKGDDLIRGKVGPVEFEGSELHAVGTFTSSRKRNKNAAGGPNVTEFKGMMFHFALPRTLNGHTIVEPERCEGRFIGHRKGFEQIEMDDEAFAERFRVYTTDEAEARRVLSPEIRARLVAVAEHLPYPPFLAFVRHHAFVAAHHTNNLLEPTIAKAATYGTVTSIAEFFGMPALLVRELALEGGAGGSEATRFATTVAAGGSILGRAPAEGMTHFDANTPITTAALMDAAFEEADEDDTALPPPPASRVRLAPLTGDGFEVAYGIGPSFWIRLLWTLGLAPFVAAGAARLAGEAGAPIVDAIAAQIPIAAEVANLAGAWPIPFIAIALLFWVIPTWGMAHIPRSVRIDRQGVTVRRLVWPLALHWPLDRIDGVKVNDRQVLLQRENASLLRRFAVLAPNLPSEKDARWLAAHCRRALLMFGGLRG